MQTDQLFTVLANPVRRRMLEILMEGSRTAGSLAGEFELSRPAVSEHIGILHKAGLLEDEKQGREIRYSLNAAPMAEVRAWLEPFENYWRERLKSLSDMLEEKPE